MLQGIDGGVPGHFKRNKVGTIHCVEMRALAPSIAVQLHTQTLLGREAGTCLIRCTITPRPSVWSGDVKLTSKWAAHESLDACELV